jgi:glycosyltransferase involved in cell wall biosynthesis
MTADTVGGVWTYAVQLASRLASADVEIVLATMGRAPSADQRAECARLPNVTVRESAFRLEWMPDPWEDVRRAGDWLLEIAEEWRPDVVHLNGYAHASLPWRAPVLVVAHSCVCSWWEAVRRTPLPAEWAPYRAAVSRGLAAADLVIAPSHAMRRTLERHYGGVGAHVVPNARDAGDLDDDTPKESLVFAAGRLWDEAKNVLALDAAAARLAWPVFVAGDTTAPDGSTVRPTHLRALGPRPAREVLAWMSRAAVYAFPARYEPFGLSVLEAALARCALVLGDIESLRENWTGAALFVPPDDPGALAAAIDRLASHEAERRGLAERARERARWFTPERQRRAYLHAYARLHEQRRPGDLRHDGGVAGASTTRETA